MGCGIQANCLHVGPLSAKKCPLWKGGGIFLKDPSSYLREFQRKPWKTPNSLVDKRHQGCKKPVKVVLGQNNVT